MSEESLYSLRRSVEEIGILYPILLDAHGGVIDGFHRLRENPNWPAFKLEHIDTKAKSIMARIIANIHRREVSAEEKTKWLVELKEETGWSNKEIADKLGMTRQWVLKYLPVDYKSEAKAEAGKLGGEAKAEKLAKRRLAKPEQKEPKPIEFPATQHVTEPGKPSAKPRPSFSFRKPGEEPENRFIKGLSLWFLSPNHPVQMALARYCISNKVHWHVVVEQALTQFLKKAGFLID